MALKNFNLCFLFLLIFAANGCKDDDGNDGGNACGSDFDQTAMLTTYADDLFIPEFDELKTGTDNLKAATDAFLSTTDAANLAVTRQEIRNLYGNYATKEMLEVGPAIDVDLRNVMNPFPVNEDQVDFLLENTVDNYVYGFDRGLPALEYIFFGQRTDEEILVLFTNEPANQVARDYLTFVVGSMAEAVASVSDSWNGGYRATFIANTGTAAGGSVSQLVNALNEHWELTKRDRLGIPAGIATLGITNPETVEGLYLGNSLELLQSAIRGNKAMFDTGLKAYIDFVDARKSGTLLSQLITEQYTDGLTKVAALPVPLTETVDEMPGSVADAYAALVRNIVLLKTDMPSVLCVAITYVDNPSDSD